MLVVAIAAAPAIPAAAQPPAATPSWRVTTLDQVDLWYHGVALLGVGVPEPAGLYDAAYAPAVRRTKARLRVAATPLERASRDLASTFEREPAFEIIHFLPLYFAASDWPAMLQALRTLAGDDGLARGRTDPRTSRAVGALAAILPQPAQRTALRRFGELLDEEWRVYLRDETRRAAGRHAAQARALEQRWNAEFAPGLARYLAQIGRAHGTIVLTSALGREGRTVERIGDATAGALVAIAAPRADTPEETTAAAFDVLRELCFATARVVGDRPGEPPVDAMTAELASRIIAVRCGALVLQRYLPQHRAAYQARFLALRMPAAPPDSTTDRFERAFPLPSQVAHRLALAIESP